MFECVSGMTSWKWNVSHRPVYAFGILKDGDGAPSLKAVAIFTPAKTNTQQHRFLPRPHLCISSPRMPSPTQAVRNVYFLAAGVELVVIFAEFEITEETHH